MHFKFLSINEVVESWCCERLDTPNSGDDSNIHVSHMCIVHGEENKTLNSKEKAALNTKSEDIHPPDIPSDDQVLVVPAALLNWLERHVEETTEYCPRTQVENTRETINFGSDQTDDAVS
jgi:hypothetical protein